MLTCIGVWLLCRFLLFVISADVSCFCLSFVFCFCQREVGLLSSLMITSGRQVVGLSSGYLRPYSHTRNRKQVIVIVNESFGIYVFNHKLRLMWTRTIEADLSLRYLSEVSILIDPHPMRRGVVGGGSRRGRASSSRHRPHNDTGVIIIGGRLGLKSDLGKNVHGLHRESTSPTGPTPLEFPSDYAEVLAGRILRPGKKRGYLTSNDVKDHAESHLEDLRTDPFHFEREQHFSYYAFEGLQGSVRWKHDSTSFHEEMNPNLLMKPQHDSVHSGEMDWRIFRKSILDHALPHAWFGGGGRQGTVMNLAHVEKTRQGHQRQSIKAKRQIKSNFFVRDTLNLRPHSDSEHIEKPNAIIVHLKDGLEILHFYSGRPLCRLTLKSGQVHVDMNGDGTIDHVEAVGGIHLPRTRTISNHGHGEPTLSKCLGRVSSGIPTIRQLFNGSICQTSWTDVMRFGGASSILPSSSSSSSSFGVGRSSPTGFSLDGSIIGEGVVGDATNSNDDIESPSRMNRFEFLANSIKEEQERQAVLKVAHPIVIQEPKTIGKRQTAIHTTQQRTQSDGIIVNLMFAWLIFLLFFSTSSVCCDCSVLLAAKKRRFHSFFYLNTGLVTSFNHDGTRSWRVQTRASWLHGSAASAAASSSSSADLMISSLQQSFQPSITKFQLHSADPSSEHIGDHALVIGERYVSLISFGGHLRAELPLIVGDPVISRPIIGDFDSDGLNDIILMTPKGFYGYRITRRLGGELFSFLVLGLLFLIVTIFVLKLVTTTNLNAIGQQYRNKFGNNHGANNIRGRTTFTGGLRQMTKSTKAQL